MSKFKNKYLFLVILTALIFFNLFSKDVHADEINFAVSPSKIVNLVIEPGKSEILKFKVGNRSIFPVHQTEKNDLYEISVTVEAEMTGPDGEEIDTKNIVKISNTLLKAKPNQKAAQTEVEIKIPKDFEQNSYRLDIVFTRKPIKGIEDTSNTNAITSIKVPIYMGVGDPEEYKNLKTDYEIKDLNIDLGEESTVFKYALNNLKELITINPFKVYDVFSTIDEKEIYVVNKNNKTSVDVLSGMYTEMRNAVTYTDKTNDKKYIKIKQEDENKEVSNVYFNDREVDFRLTDGTSIKIECHNKVRDNIRTQINNLIRENNLSKPRLRFFLDNLLVPSNQNFNILEYKANLLIKNTGEKENFVNANVSLKKDSSFEVGKQKVELLTLMKGETLDISVPLDMTSEITSGTYSLTADLLDIKNNAKSKTFNFNVDLDIDKDVFWLTLILYVIIIIIIIIIILVILSLLRKKKGIIGFIQTPYIPVEKTEENFNLYAPIFDLKEIDELDCIARVSLNDTILRDKPSMENSKQLAILMAMSVVQILEVNVESSDNNNVLWTKVRYKEIKEDNKNQTIE